VTTVASVFTPNEIVSRRTIWAVVAGWIVVWLAYWTATRPAVFPTPLEILQAFPTLWLEDGLGPALITSFTTNAEALALATAVALPLAYLSRVPAIWPLAAGLAELRVLSPAVFLLILLFVAPSGHAVKVLMLALGEACFLAQTMIGVVQAVPREALDDCRTLRMSEWQATWYAVVRGTTNQAFDAIRDNASMGWAMVMMVEGVVRSEGGAGVLILNSQKHFNFGDVYAVAIAITLVGIGQDWTLGQLRRAACPWAEQ
jgi:NitT/TauT family transport system permease protein